MRGGDHLIDRSTQLWVRATGRRLGLGDHPWLDGPIGSPDRIADSWFEAEADRIDGSVQEGGGLLDMSVLRAPNFDPGHLDPRIVDFYEHTDRWRLDVWSQWCAAMWPFGWILSTLFARRLEQLALPLRPLDVALGLTSRVRTVRAADGSQLGAIWLRTLRSTGTTVYSGWYGTAMLPHAPGPSVRVVFPLPNGNVTVFLRPQVDAGGGLVLRSPHSRFGDDGPYLLVSDRARSSVWVRRIPIAETFRLYVDEDEVADTVRTDHSLNLWRLPVIRLHYRLTPTAGTEPSA